GPGGAPAVGVRDAALAASCGAVNSSAGRSTRGTPACGSTGTRPPGGGHRASRSPTADTGPPHRLTSKSPPRLVDSPEPEAGSTPLATASPRDRPAGLTGGVHPPGPRRSVASRTALQLSVEDVLDRGVLERQVRVHPLQLGVFAFELAEPLHIRDRRPAILAPPLEEGGFANADLPK